MGYTRNIKMKYRNNVIYINSPNTLPNQYSPIIISPFLSLADVSHPTREFYLKHTWGSVRVYLVVSEHFLKFGYHIVMDFCVLIVILDDVGEHGGEGGEKIHFC